MDSNKSKNKKLWLSHSGIEGMYRCPRCFWLQYNQKLRQPEGIVSRLANRFDIILKKYFDIYRPLGELPPMVEGKIEGKLEYPFQEKYFWDYDEKYGLTGRLDDCLIRGDGTYTPIDHKTSSSDPRDKEGVLSAYQHQLNFYALLLQKNNKPTSGFGHLIYYYPEHGEELHNGVPIHVHVQTLKTNPEQAEQELLKAIKLLEGNIPKPSSDCPFCLWHEQLKELKL
ncbi:MAG: PD-(D/E)XK nuclease family protein [bacterium]|nr:PD-(D/E)XK nuclease family protein [bacterium]